MLLFIAKQLPFLFLSHLYGLYLFNTIDDVYVDGNSHHSRRSQHVAGTVLITLWAISPFHPFMTLEAGVLISFSQTRKWKLRKVQRRVPKVTRLVSRRSGI